MTYNKQAIIVKSNVDKIREQQELIKFMFYSQDNSEGTQLLIKDTEKKGFFRARYLNPDSLELRKSIFSKK